MKVDVVVSRAALVDALSGHTTTTLAGQLTGVLPARASVVVRSDRSRTPWMMWMGDSHALVATGDDPVALGRIRLGGAGLAVLDALDMRRGGEVRAGSWWEVRIASGDHTDRIGGFDRSPCGTWLVRDSDAATRVEPATLSHIARTVSSTVARHAGVAPPSSLV